MVTVNDGTGTLPAVDAHHSAPKSSTSAADSAAERVSFQSTAGRSGVAARRRGRRGRAAGAPTATAATSPALPVSASATRRAAAHSAGSVSDAIPPRRRRPAAVCTRWGARPVATTSPESTSTTTTLVAWVEQSTPATSCSIVLVSPR